MPCYELNNSKCPHSVKIETYLANKDLNSQKKVLYKLLNHNSMEILKQNRRGLTPLVKFTTKLRQAIVRCFYLELSMAMEVMMLQSSVKDKQK
jgi:hypothetical protein